MTGSTAEHPDLGPVVAAARSDPGLLAGRVAAAGPVQAVADRLGLDRPRLQRLLLCKPPVPSRFAGDVRALAEYVDADPAALAAVLREVDAVGALRGQRHQPLQLGDADAGGSGADAGAGSGGGASAGLLAAARDAADDHVSSAQQQAERLRELAREFWDAAPDPVRRERDVEAAAAWSVRLAVVAMPRLTLADIHAWLRERDVEVTGDRGDIALRGFLVAWRGVGVAFCDGTLDAGERRFTLAHEIGHFLLDYERPRRRVLREAPELLEVVDGVRPASASDRAHAVLARVPLGVHTHLLTAGAETGRPGAAAEAESAEAEDDASRFGLELLAPWDEVVDLVRDTTVEPAPYRLALADGAQRIAGAFEIPAAAARTRARQALDALDIRPGFFDR